MYVNSATCTNTFLPTGTVVGSQRNAIFFLERERGSAMVLNRAVLPERTYDAEELASALQDATNAAAWLSSDYTCTYNVEKADHHHQPASDGTELLHSQQRPAVRPSFFSSGRPTHEQLRGLRPGRHEERPRATRPWKRLLRQR